MRGETSDLQYDGSSAGAPLASLPDPQGPYLREDDRSHISVLTCAIESSDRNLGCKVKDTRTQNANPE